MNDNAANSTVANSGSTGGNGTFVGNLGGADSYTSSHDASGKINGALNFTYGVPNVSNRDYIDGGTNSGLLPTNMTVSAWFASTNEVAANIIMGWNQYYFLTVGYKKRTSGGVKYYSVELYRASTTNNYARFDVLGGTLFDGNWHHVVLSITGTTDQNAVISSTKAYINGYNMGAPYQYGTTTASTGFSHFTIADTYTGGGVYPFKGDLDDIRVYDGIIRQDQVSWLYGGKHPNGTGTESDLTH